MFYIKNLPQAEGQSVTLQGWVANKRTGKGLVFLVLRDGSGFTQAVINEEVVGENVFNESKRLTLESAVALTGNVVKDDRQEGGFELQVESLKIYQIAEEYPIAKKEHGVEFLMDNRHLWLRSRKQWANMRVRNAVIFAVHTFFQEKGFVQMDAPLFTGNACEGTTELFETDFYGDTAYLSQSGQLYGEAMAMAQGLIYTFGPTFRAEKSKTRRHLSEFWMIEPEMAFYDNEKNMELIEEFIRSVVGSVLNSCETELEILERDTTLLEKVNQPFPKITYTEAVQILKGNQPVEGKTTKEVLEADLAEVESELKAHLAEIESTEATLAAGGLKKGKVNYFTAKVAKLKSAVKQLEEQQRNIPQWLNSALNFKEGEDFGGSDETVLTRLFGTPIMVYNWPKDIKAFYMKEVEDDPRFVKGVDVLAPEGYGEIVGGAERETDLQTLIDAIKHHELPMDAFEWYLDLRRFGSVPHAGFGLGLERFVSWITGAKHVRETIPFARSYGRLLP